MSAQKREGCEKRIRTVEYDPAWGWIARNPWTGKEVIEDFRWRTRDIARAVVDEARLLSKPAALTGGRS